MEEVVDLEEMTDGVSLTDLGLNEFRLDLLDYIKNHLDIARKPFGLHSVTAALDMPRGVIFVLKNRNPAVNVDHQNRLHPFYMIYVADDGSIVNDHLAPKKLLDTMRRLCRGVDAPIKALYQPFNVETDDGRDMSSISKLLNAAVDSVIERKADADIDSLFRPGLTTALTSTIAGLDDFELICFLVVR